MVAMRGSGWGIQLLTVQSASQRLTDQTLMITKIQVEFGPYWLSRHYNYEW